MASSSLKNLFGNSTNVSSTQSIMQKLAADRQKSGNKSTIEKDLAKVADAEGESDNDSSDSEEASDLEENEEIEEPAPKKLKKRRNDNDDDIEGKYMAKLMKETEKQEKERKSEQPVAAAQDSENKDESDSDSDSDKEDAETAAEAKPATSIDLKEKELKKAEKTIFVGNLPVSVLKDKKAYRRFKKLFSTNPHKPDDIVVEDTKEEKEEEEEEEEEEERSGSAKESVNPYTIESIRFRSIAFSEALPRKVAFSQLKFDEKRDSLNSYIVYKNKNVKKLNQLIKTLNGTVFENHHLRVDSITHPAEHDKKRSIFVGNLDFEENEESLWKHFSQIGKIEYVRIIRDSKTNMGKGFAYVQFNDSSDVNKALLLNEKPISSTVAKKARKLRVSRCKNLSKQGSSNDSTLSESRNGTLSVKANLNNTQKTKIGRANKVLGKMDKKTLGKQLTIEGERATKIDKNVNSVLGKRKRKPRSKDGRAAKRSAAHKEKLAAKETKK
ncbi:hypothetical protein ACO0QE_003202 [Hanseniaspora vineae]